jgi:hypothetical protein
MIAAENGTWNCVPSRGVDRKRERCSAERHLGAININESTGESWYNILLMDVRRRASRPPTCPAS